MQKILLSISALLLLLPNLFTSDINPLLQYNGKEKFDTSLSHISSISLLEKYTDSIANTKQIEQGSYEYTTLLEAVIAARFYHGFSHFSPSQNWIAAFAGTFIKEDYACIVQPEKMMQFPNAACSQQSMVMMAVLRNKNISYRSLGFPHHYAMEILVNKEWYFFDANMEPIISKEQRSLTNWQHQSDNLKQYYDKNRYGDLGYAFGDGLTATVGAINDTPAKNARAFHIVTGVLSKIAWLFPLLFIFFPLKLNVRKPFISLQRKKQGPSVYLPA
jgi:hypothetical protein